MEETRMIIYASYEIFPKSMPNSYIIQELTSHDRMFYRSLIAHLPIVHLLFILGPAIISILSTGQQ
jgi:hypothetical protein